MNLSCLVDEGNDDLWDSLECAVEYGDIEEAQGILTKIRIKRLEKSIQKLGLSFDAAKVKMAVKKDVYLSELFGSAATLSHNTLVYIFSYFILGDKNLEALYMTL